MKHTLMEKASWKKPENTTLSSADFAAKVKASACSTYSFCDMFAECPEYTGEDCLFMYAR